MNDIIIDVEDEGADPDREGQDEGHGMDAGDDIGGNDGDAGDDAETVHHGEVIPAGGAGHVSGDASALYARYSEEEARELRDAVEAAKHAILNSAVEMGRALARARSLVKYGEWGEWLSLEFSMTDRTARNLMSLVNVVDTATARFGHEGETRLLTYPQHVLYKVGDRTVPEDARTEIVERIIEGEFADNDQILEAVSAAKAEGRRQKEESGAAAPKKAKADDDTVSAAERRKMRAEALRRLSAYNLAVSIVTVQEESEDSDTDDLSPSRIVASYGEIGSGNKGKMTPEDHVMFSEMLLKVAQAHIRGGFPAVLALTPLVPEEPTPKAKAPPKAKAEPKAKKPKKEAPTDPAE